jgi:hypothetical protein
MAEPVAGASAERESRVVHPGSFVVEGRPIGIRQCRKPLELWLTHQPLAVFGQAPRAAA